MRLQSGWKDDIRINQLYKIGENHSVVLFYQRLGPLDLCFIYSHCTDAALRAHSLRIGILVVAAMEVCEKLPPTPNAREYSWPQTQIVPDGYVVPHEFYELTQSVQRSFITGDILALFHRHEGWEYTKMLADKHDAVVRLRGPVGVSTIFTRPLLYSSICAVEHLICA